MSNLKDSYVNARLAVKTYLKIKRFISCRFQVYDQLKLIISDVVLN